jgi:hypothetical protein
MNPFSYDPIIYNSSKLLDKSRVADVIKNLSWTISHKYTKERVGALHYRCKSFT